MLTFKYDFSLNKPLPSITLFDMRNSIFLFKLKLLFNGYHNFNSPCCTHTGHLNRALSKHSPFVILFSVLQGNTIYLETILFNVSGRLCYLPNI